MKRNVMKIIEKCRMSGKIIERYDMKVSDAITIQACCSNNYELITRSFVFGYAQGYKAAMAEMKRKQR